MRNYLAVFLLPLLVILSTINADCQEVKFGYLEVYGYVNKEQVTACISLRDDDTYALKEVSLLKQQLKDCLLSLPGVKEADISFVCCDNMGTTIIYAGTSEKKSGVNPPRERSDIQLSAVMMQAYDSLLYHAGAGVRKGDVGDDHSRGYSLFNYPPARRIQESFINTANKNLDVLKDVLRNSKHDQHRIAAATIIAYADNRSIVAEELVAASTDENEEVRNNAIRALSVLADYSANHPNAGYSIPVEPFIALMNSLSWTDRNKSSMVLLSLSQTNKQVLQQLKEKALKSLIEMAAWKNEGHSFPGIILLGRIAGWEDDRIMKSLLQDKTQMVKSLIADLSIQ